MLALFSFLHFLGVSLMVGGEAFIAMVAIKAEKDDTALSFFVSFLGNITAFMWAGMLFSLVGGIGLAANGIRPEGALFILKMVLFILVAVTAVVLNANVKKVQKSATDNLTGLRHNPVFKRMDMLSKATTFLVMAIMVVSVIM